MFPEKFELRECCVGHPANCKDEVLIFSGGTIYRMCRTNYIHCPHARIYVYDKKEEIVETAEQASVRKKAERDPIPVRHLNAESEGDTHG